MIVESYEDVIVLSGELRSNFWDTIRTAIALTLKRHPTGVIIDCSGITHMTPEGGETFHDAIDFVAEHDHARIVVAGVPEKILEVLRSVPEVRSQLPIADTVEDARRSLDLLVEDEDDEPKKKKKKKKGSEVREYDRVIIAVLSGDDSDDELLHVTNEFVSTLPAKVVMLFPIIVPRNLPLQAPMPEVEERALKAIEMGKERMKQYKTAYEVRLEHARDLPTLIHDVAEEAAADRVIFAISRRSPEKLEEGVKLISLILQKVACPVMFVRGKTDV